jgi:hypothetical protein
MVREDGTVDFDVLDSALAFEAENAKGDDAKAYQGMRKVIGELVRRQQEYLAAVDEAAEAGAFEYADAGSVEVVRARKAKVAELRQTHLSYYEYDRQMDDAFDAELVELGVGSGDRAKFVRDFAAGYADSSKHARRILEIEGDMLDDVAEAHSILETHWGNWEPNDKGGIDFDGDLVPAEERERFLAAMNSLIAKGVEQEQLHALIEAER